MEKIVVEKNQKVIVPTILKAEPTTQQTEKEKCFYAQFWRTQITRDNQLLSKALKHPQSYSVNSALFDLGYDVARLKKLLLKKQIIYDGAVSMEK